MVLRKFEEYHAFYLEVDAETAKPLLAEGNKRVLVVLPDGTKLHHAIARLSDGFYWIGLNKQIVKRFRLQEGKPVSGVTIRRDESELQFEVPEELIEVLAQDDHAYQVFESLTPGNKRSIMHMVNMLKSTDKRIERSLMIAEKLKRGITKGQDMMKKDEPL